MYFSFVAKHEIKIYCFTNMHRQNQSLEKEIIYFLKIITCYPSTYAMDHPDLTVSNFLGNSIGPKMVNQSHRYLLHICLFSFF